MRDVPPFRATRRGGAGTSRAEGGRVETVALVPMGLTEIRIALFPWLYAPGRDVPGLTH